MNSHWGTDSSTSGFWDRFWPRHLNTSPDLSGPSFRARKPVFSLACYAGLVRYVGKQLCSTDANPTHGYRPHDNLPPAHLAQYALDCVVFEMLDSFWCRRQPFLKDAHLEILALALRSGADPNMTVHMSSHSSWQVAVLPPCPRTTEDRLGCTQHWALLLERLIQAGADVCSLFNDSSWDIELKDRTKVNARWAMSPLAIIQNTILNMERTAALPSMVRKFRLILGGIERLIYQRGGYSIIVVEERIKTEDGEEWAVVNDPQREEDIKRGLLKFGKPYHRLWPRYNDEDI